jgi:hypothetical protein
VACSWRHALGKFEREWPQELPASYDPSHPARARIDGAKRSLFGLFTLLPLAMG